MHVLSLLLCEDIRKELQGTLTIVGQFNALRGYLMDKSSFQVFFSITDFLGMAKFKVVVRSPEGVSLKTFYTEELPCTSRKDHYAGFFRIKDLTFKSYGRYSISLYDKNEVLLSSIGVNYLVPNFKSNKIKFMEVEIEVPRVNYHDDRELSQYAKLFLRKFSPLTKSQPINNIEFHSQFVGSDGIGSVSRHFVDQMVKDKVRVNPIPIYADPESVGFIKGIPEESRFSGVADLTIVNALPPHIKNASNAKRLLLFSYWEASEIDKSWVNVSNTADAVLVPSDYVKQVYENSGVTKPVIVYRQPIDPIFEYRAKEDKEYFDILFLGTCIPRKGIDLFTKAVDKVYGGDKTVRIRIHTKPWSESLGDTSRDLHREYKDNKQYLITNSILSTKGVVELMQSADLMVAPSRSEGLGLIPIQSVMCGTPCIVPNHSGFKEYNQLPGFTLIEKYEEPQGKGIYTNGSWFEPDFEELCSKLKECRDNRETLLEEARIGSDILREEYGVTKTYSDLKKLIYNVYA